MTPNHPQNITTDKEVKLDPREFVEMRHDRVLAQEVVLKPKSAIHLPAGVSDQRRTEVVVVSVGPGRYDHGVKLEPPCKKGDALMIIPGAGHRFDFCGKTYLVLESGMILGVKNRDLCKEMEAEEERLFTDIANFIAG